MRTYAPRTAVPITDAVAVGNLRTRITLADGRKLTLKNESVEIIRRHALISARFAKKIGALPNKKSNLNPTRC